MAIWNKTLEVTQNQDDPFVLGFATADPSGTLSLAVPYAFGGTYVEFTARYSSDPNSTLLVTQNSAGGAITFGTAVISGATVATLNFVIPHATSVNFPVGSFYYDILWVSGTTNTYLAAGPFVVAPSVSR